LHREAPTTAYLSDLLQADVLRRELSLALPPQNQSAPAGGKRPLKLQNQPVPEFGKRPLKLADRLGEFDVDDGESTDDGESSDDDQGLCPTYSENAALPSVGSAAHSEGKCKRCCFFPKGRCSNGIDCQFCHFAHEKRKTTKTKKKKNRRRRQRQGATQTLANCSVQSPQSSSVQQILGSSMCWVQPQTPQKPSKLIVHDLQFVPSAVLPGHSSVMPSQSNTLPTMMMWHGC